MLWVLAVMIGSVVSLSAVWSSADIANGMMAIPNLICLLAMTGVVVAETRTHLWDTKSVLPTAGERRPAVGDH